MTENANIKILDAVKISDEKKDTCPSSSSTDQVNTPMSASDGTQANGDGSFNQGCICRKTAAELIPPMVKSCLCSSDYVKMIVHYRTLNKLIICEKVDALAILNQIKKCEVTLKVSLTQSKSRNPNPEVVCLKGQDEDGRDDCGAGLGHKQCNRESVLSSFLNLNTKNPESCNSDSIERFITYEIPIFTPTSTSQSDSQRNSVYLSTKDSEECEYYSDRSVETSIESYNESNGEAKPMTEAVEIKINGFPRRTIDNAWHVDSGCSRHMTGLKDLLTDFRINDGGYVAIVGDEKGGM
ncbi:hypothetical protein L1987_20560 [Smallanthus sonchifolius]|uniref:Uncharacterized protein n=1 Tax=Smallanthus sonchifolius TaxID=185202 RepID=A0ACB9IRL6_9ASTR|nr:hypothetical protein L1987_20560 [Smallanthus sonchifolius]